MAQLENGAIVADLNNLFQKRHELAIARAIPHADNDGDLFAEITGPDRRDYTNLTQKSYEAETLRLPAPRRATGTQKICDLPRLIEAMEQTLEAGQHAPLIEIKRLIPTKLNEAAAVATLNASLPSGALGFGDFRLSLCIDPDPCSQEWIDNLERPLHFTAFSDLVYSCGGAIVPKESQPASLNHIAQMLKLDVCAGIADLLNVCNGLEIAGETEETIQIDANTGDSRVLLAKKGKASIPVPTGIVINWEVFPDFCAPVLVRLTRRIVDGAAVFTMKAVNLESVRRRLAQEISAHLHDNLDQRVAIQLEP